MGEVAIKMPEETNECLAYVPENYHPDVAYGVVLWLHEPGGFDRKKLIGRWKDLCERERSDPAGAAGGRPHPLAAHRGRLRPQDPGRGDSKYNVDRTRIVACGHQAGGAMAMLAAFSHRNLIRARGRQRTPPCPARLQVPANDPIERLAIFLTIAEKSDAAERVEEQVRGCKR